MALDFLHDGGFEAVRRKRACTVAGMHAGFLDMLHHPGDHDVLAVRNRIDIDLDRVAQILVDENRAVA